MKMKTLPRVESPRPSSGVLEARRSFLLRVAGLAGAAAVAALAGSPDEALAAPLTAAEVAGKVQTFYDATKTFQAGFKQTYTIKLQNKKKESKGKVAFEKPGKMSFIYAEPNGNRVVSDGKIIKVYEKDAEQMYETAVGKSQYPAALAFLMGEGKLTKDFNLKLLDAKTMKFEGGHVLEGTPKSDTPAYQKILLYVDAQTSQVRRVLILDAQGNRNRFDFEDPSINKPVPEGTFEFVPPKGTKVIKP